MEYEAVIGLEVHVQLKTKTKAFCNCRIEFGSPPNSLTCPVCLGLPGSLPVLNKTALDYAIKTGLALNCSIQEFTKFDRKHYYYPDLPKNFQISQYDLPVCKDGFLDIEVKGETKRIRIKRAHLEEDAGKLIHESGNSLLDLNRTGIPLLEIVSEPDIHSPLEAHEYLSDLKMIVEYLEASDCDMEKGTLRCDANISLRPKGAEELGIKTELKNMNSFKGVKDALTYEIQRQKNLLENGEKIIQQTLLWDPKESKTVVMRTKEEAKDYRYFPEPDLPPFIISQEKIKQAKSSLPELPKEKLQRFVNEYGLLEYDARILISDKDKANYSEECFRAWPAKFKKPVANWLIGPLANQAGVPAKNLVELIDLVENKHLISHLTGKNVLEEMIASKKTALAVIQEKNLAQISDEGTLDKEIAAVIKDNAKSVEDFKSGKANALMFLVGQVMKNTKGKANPKVAQEILMRRLNDA